MPDLPAARLPGDAGGPLALGAPGHCLYNNVRAANDKRYDCREATPQQPDTRDLERALAEHHTARSSHLGGVLALSCDGHTQFITDSINVLVWQGLGSRDGGEVISADTY